MNIAKILKEREPEWKELEELTSQMSRKIFFAARDADRIAKFVSLYRRVCSDLALAKSYHVPAETIRYLNNLAGRAHHQLYRTQRSGLRGLWHLFFVETPRRLVSDRVFWVAAILFWLPFWICWFRASTDHEFACNVIGAEQIEGMEEMYSRPFDSVTAPQRIEMVGYYIKNNAGIGLQCFSFGILGGVGGLFIVVFNSVYIGTIFGVMSGPNVDPVAAAHFNEFILAHGPFELTAIVLSAAAGMKMGFGFIWTEGYARCDSVRRAALHSAPIITVACVLFVLAALLEAFISPSPFFSREAKVVIANLSAVMLVYYIFVLGGMACYKSSRDTISISERENVP